jgi:hypothetical protein
MRKNIVILFMVVFLAFPGLIYAMDVSVDITGPQDLGTLKVGIEKTIVARCISKGVQLESYKKLNVTISKFGDVISYDAVLDTVPPHAFHKDLKDTANLSGTIDAMIETMFIAVPEVQVVPYKAGPQKEKGLKNVAGAKLKLPFVANSIGSIGERIFISDPTTVYELKAEKPSPVWHTPGKIEILRIYPYQDTLIVLGKLDYNFRSFKIKDGKTLERWDKAVVPLGKGLVVSEIYSDNASSRSYRWLPVKQLDGSSPQLPNGLDMITAVTSEVGMVSTGTEILSFTQENKLAVYSGSSMLKKTDHDAGIVPDFIEDTTITPPTRYYLKPRIVVAGGKIVTFENDQGLARWMPRIPMFEATQIIVYTDSGDEFDGTTVATYPKSYCADITLASGKVAALIVKEKNTYIQFLDL